MNILKTTDGILNIIIVQRTSPHEITILFLIVHNNFMKLSACLVYTQPDEPLSTVEKILQKE